MRACEYIKLFWKAKKRSGFVVQKYNLQQYITNPSKLSGYKDSDFD